MRKLLTRITDLPYRAAAAAAVAAVAAPTAANATSTGIGGVATSIKGNLDELANLLVAGSFLGGVGLSGAGLLKLKQAADTGGQQVKYSEGIWRVGVGAALVALPAMTESGRATLFGSGTGTGPTMGTITIN